jgi:membrane protease YdiL (CAAX protease family)
LDEISVDTVAEVELTPIVPPVTRPRIWTVFATTVAGTLLTIAFQVVVVVGIIAGHAAQGRDVQQRVQQLPEELATPGMFMLMVGGAQVAFGVCTFIAALLSKTPFQQRLGLVPAKQSWLIYPLTMIGSWAVLAIGLAFASALALVIPPDPGVEQLFENIGPTDAVPFVLFIALFPGVFEELLFRGYVQRRLLERWRPALAILVTSLLFAIVHFQPHHVVLAFPLGIWLGIVAWRTGSVFPSICCHAFVNGSLNAWRMVVKFGDVPQSAQAAVPIAALVVGFICLVLSVNLFGQDSEHPG